MSVKLPASFFKDIKKAMPGAVVDCVWARVTSRVYVTATGTYTNTSTSTAFVGIKGEYRAIDRIGGIEVGDCKLVIDSVSVPSMPPIGAVITWGTVAHEVVDAKDFAGIAFELQMRRK